MANFDQLPAQQKAIIELVLRRGQTYEDLADMLGMPEARVRDLAREALSELSPRSAARVDDDWRGQVADYILGQQSGPESNATKGHMKRSEAARAWAYSLLDALDDLYDNGDRPVIPDGDAGAARRPRSASTRAVAAAPAKKARRPAGHGDDEDLDEEDEEPRRSPLSPEAARVVKRRRLFALGGGLAALIAAALVVFVWSPWSDDEKKASASEEQAQARIVKRVVLQPLDRSDRESAGLAVIGEQDGKLSLIVTAQLPRNKRTEAYEVWLYNSKTEAVSLGAQQTDQAGIYQGAGPLPADYEKYKYFDISREKIDRQAAHSGSSVLRGEIASASTEQSGGAGPTGTDTEPQVVAP